MSRSLFRSIIYMILCVLAPSASFAHPGSANLFVDAEDRLFLLETFDPGQFIRFGDIEVSSATPGFGVNFPANGLEPGTSLDLEIVQDLLYWDGNGLTSPGAAIEFDAPSFDNEGNPNNSQVAAYSISSNSGLLTGMHWGNYSGNNFWEAHSTYFMDTLEAPHGIYAFVMRMRADLHDDMEPTLIPFIYDPTSLEDPDGQWTAQEEADAITLLRAAMDAHQIADLNIDGHVDTTDIDLLVSESAAGSNPVAFDLTGDGVVNQNDIQEWLVQAGTAKSYTSQPFLVGDANLDGNVDGLDFDLWRANRFTSTAAWSAGDFTGDGVVDAYDFLEWNRNKDLSVNAPAVSVPEPMNTLLLALVSLTFWWRRSEV